MSAASALSVGDPHVAGEAVPGVALLRLAQRFMQAGMAFARSVTRIAQHKVMGEDLSRLAPPGFDATLTNAWVMQAVAWTAALRERLRALAGRPPAPLVPRVPGTERVSRGRGARRMTVTFEATPGDRHDWVALAKPWRIGPGGVAATLRIIAGKSDREVVSQISDFLRRAAGQLGAEADLPRIAALEAAALALCPAAEAAADSGGAKGAPTAGPSSDAPEEQADDDPPAERPDG